MPREPRGRAAATTVAVIAALLLLHGPLLRSLWVTLTLGRPAYSWDAYTNYLRVLFARDYYLPSGHHWGWNPFWFQGFVPFLLNPHLHYMLLGGLAASLPVEPVRLFNAFTVAVFFAWPLAAALPVLYRSGLAAALLAAVWIGSVSCAYGGGARGLFLVGLLSQGVGLCVFSVLVYDLVVAGRIDRAGIWLGLTALVHVHTALVAGLAWAATGLGIVASRSWRRADLARWCEGSVTAFLVAAPSVLGFWLGRGQMGPETAFPFPDVWSGVRNGRLIAPWPVVAAVVLGALAAVGAAPPGRRGRRGLAVLVGVLLVVLSLQRWATGLAGVDKALRQVLRLRALPFAFAWIAVVAVSGWAWLPRLARLVLVALTLYGVALGWSYERGLATWVGRPFREGRVESRSSRQFARGLEWIASDVGAGVATVAVLLEPSPPIGHPLGRAADRLRLPVLAGRGIEFTAVHNESLVYGLRKLRCEVLKRQVRAYAVGYVIGGDAKSGAHLARCVGHGPAWRDGAWWVFATGWRWDNYAPVLSRFARNASWTELAWDLAPKDRPVTLRLPVADTAPWAAELDGTPVPIAASADGMMSVPLAAGARALRLRYRGWRGEWASVMVSGGALLVGLARARRRRAGARR